MVVGVGCSSGGAQESVNDEWWWLLYNTETLYAALRADGNIEKQAPTVFRVFASRAHSCFGLPAAFLEVLALAIYCIDPHDYAYIITSTCSSLLHHPCCLIIREH